MNRKFWKVLGYDFNSMKHKSWQTRPLDSIYPFVCLDAIHYKIKDGWKYVLKAVYTVLGVNMEGKKNILGFYLSESEEALLLLDEKWGKLYPIVLQSWNNK